MHKGIVSRIESKDYYVLTPDGNEIRCSLRGKFKKLYNLKKDKLFALDIAAVGDTVNYSILEDGSGVIEKIAVRKNYLSRKAPRIKGASHRGERLEQIIASNIDQVCIVSSIREPKLKNGLIDRIIVSAVSSKIDVHILINKIDLDDTEEPYYWKQLYEEIGYKVLLTSTKTNEGLDSVRKLLKNKASVFWGQSGVGKSSLFNSVFPQINFQTGVVSNQTEKGKHTTVTSNLQRIDDNTIIIDTPGIREIDPYGIKKTDLGHYFIEFEDYIHSCRFNTCTHHHEPGCAVIEAVESDEISIERYRSYLGLLDSIESDINY